MLGKVKLGCERVAREATAQEQAISPRSATAAAASVKNVKGRQAVYVQGAVAGAVGWMGRPAEHR